MSRVRVGSLEVGDDADRGADIAERTADWLGVQMFKKRMDEETLAEYLADSASHCEHHSVDLNSVGKFGLSTIRQSMGLRWC
jgi:asparagine synthase (glutamine-hydrolysing)